MWANQTAVVQPRLIPSQLPWGLKHSSSSSGIPIVSLWANKIGISSTRSVVTVNGSVISTAYRIFKILSPFDRTMSSMIEILDWIGRISAGILVIALLVGIYGWSRGIIPAMVRLGNGFAKRKIAIFARSNQFVSLKDLL